MAVSYEVTKLLQSVGRILQLGDPTVVIVGEVMVL